jgi:hypothetical protein
MRLILILISLFIGSKAIAQTCDPAPQGTFAYLGGGAQYCDGTTWREVLSAGSDGLCTALETGKMKFFKPNPMSPDDINLYVCDGTTWHAMTDPNGKKGGGDACTVAGKISPPLETPTLCKTDLTTAPINIDDSPVAATMCNMYIAQFSCEANACYWHEGACTDCPCNRETFKK